MSEPVLWRAWLHRYWSTYPHLHSSACKTLAKALALIACGACAAAHAANEHTPQPQSPSAVQAIESSKASRGLLLDVAHAGPRLVAVGERGHIVYSDDQGQSWKQARVPTRQLLTAVQFVDAQRGWAVGHDAQILVSDDGGMSWNKQFEDLAREAPLLDLWFKDADTGLAVGAYGTLLGTQDGGRTWQDISDRLDNEDQYHLNGIAAVKDAGLFIVGEAGAMFRSADDGQSWEKLEGPYQGSLFGVVGTAQPRTLLAYGLRGNLFRSADFGDSWTQVELHAARGPLEFGLANASLLADGSLILVGNGGSVLRSSDDGKTFTVYNRPDRVSLAGVTANEQGNLVLVGQGGVRVTSVAGVEISRNQ